MRAKTCLLLLASLGTGAAVGLLLTGGGRGGANPVEAEGRREASGRDHGSPNAGGGVGLTGAEGSARHSARPPPPVPTLPASEGLAASVVEGMGWIEGEVLSDGVPFTGAFTVAAMREADPRDAPAEERRVRGPGGAGEGLTQLFHAGDGRFALHDVSPGDYGLTVSTAAGLVTVEPCPVTVAAGQGAGPVTLSLIAGVVVTGDVVGADGSSLAGCQLWFYRPRQAGSTRGPAGQARADDEGTFTVAGLGSGSFTVALITDAGASWTETIDLQAGETKHLHFVERIPGRVRITVVDPDGRRLEKAAPSMTDTGGDVLQPNLPRLGSEAILDGRPRDVWERASKTDVNGVLLRYHVPPGRYRVSAWLQGWTPPPDPPLVDVASNSVTEVIVTMTRAAGG